MESYIEAKTAYFTLKIGARGSARRSIRSGSSARGRAVSFSEALGFGNFQNLALNLPVVSKRSPRWLK